jgi:putative peptidoglycan lipid II flippase
VLLAARFGTGLDADALALALMLVMAAANEMGTWTGTLFLPAYIDARTRAGAAAAATIFRGCLLALAAAGALLAGLLALGAPALVPVLAPDLGARGVTLLRLFTPLLLAVPVCALLAGALQAHARFAVAGARQLCWYGTTLLALLVLGRRLGAVVVPLGMVAGFLLYGLLLVLRLLGTADVGARGARDRAVFARLGAALVPLVLASALNYVNVSFERSLAARLPEGSLASLTYAFRLLAFPVNLFVLNATTILLPALAGHAARDDTAALAALLGRALRLTVLVTAPLAALAMALGAPGIEVLLQRGAFTAHSTALTATALTWYAPGIVGMAAAQVLGRAYQARQEIPRMAGLGIVAIAANLALMPLLTALLGFRGLPVASSLDAMLLFALMLFGLRRRLPGFDTRAVTASVARAAAAAVAGGLAALLAHAAVSAPVLVELLVGTAAGLAAYAAALCVLSRADVRLLLAVLRPGARRAGALRAG